MFKCFVVSKLGYNMFEADVHTVLFNSCKLAVQYLNFLYFIFLENVNRPQGGVDNPFS